MPNAIFRAAVDQLEFLGDIFSLGIVKKGVTKVGATPDTVTREQMLSALDAHILPAVKSFVGPDKARSVKRDLTRVVSQAGA